MFKPGKNKKFSEKKPDQTEHPEKKSEPVKTRKSIFGSLIKKFGKQKEHEKKEEKKKKGKEEKEGEKEEKKKEKKEKRKEKVKPPAAGGNTKGSLVQSLISVGKQLKTRIESNEKLRALLEKIKNHPRVIWAVDKFQNLDWSERVVVLIGATGLLLFILGPYSLLYRKTHLITYEAARRGETLVHLLAAQNQPAFADKESMLYTVEFVSQELGVNDAVVTDLEGKILFPIERFGKTMDKVKTLGSRKECTRRQKGLDIEFFCPVFKWIEKDEGLVKEPMGMAYVDYSAHESLDLMGSRAFHVFYLLIIFVVVLGVVGYLIVVLTHKPLEDLRYNILAYHRGGTENLPPPENFRVLQDLTGEIVSALKGRGRDSPVESAMGGDEASLIEIIRQTALASQKEALLIDADKKLIFASDRIGGEAKMETGQHILRAVGSSPYMNELIEFFSKLLEEPSHGLTLRLPNMDPMRGMVLKLWGKDYYLVISI